MRESSYEAFQSFNSSGLKESHQREILRVLEKIGNSTSKTISDNSFLTYHQTARRLKELEDKNLIKVVGRCSEIKNRPLIWALVE